MLLLLYSNENLLVSFIFLVLISRTCNSVACNFGCEFDALKHLLKMLLHTCFARDCRCTYENLIVLFTQVLMVSI